MTLAERIDEAITQSGADVADIARACGISVQAVYAWMSGESKTLKGNSLAELAELAGYEPRWLIKGQGPKSTYPRGTPQAKVIEAMDTMDPYQVKILLKTAEAVLETQPEPGVATAADRSNSGT
jgi:transcriptional regulator with XRE-family HTH domain